MIQANELRIGNLLNYQTAEGDIVTVEVNLQLMQWLINDTKGFNLVHSPITLSEELLVKFGFEKIYKSQIHATYWIENLSYYFWHEKGNQYADCKGLQVNCVYIHQLQNLYFSLTGEELNIKNEQP